ncbi:hypothetical protein ABE65_018300 [Fictibacillus phosphorivorans]|uniref:GAF domain-containing protein n=1 Tax=Fictibacillus phosphorivorans TaxID=1221500 RepID=A0A160IRQ2_9BACL|nr:hypothetical protein [Fictibacillus phosphorivorans]ANC78642.1 hypothetical protein ABE65_018300 [Fictibacillus phosphorivorans]
MYNNKNSWIKWSELLVVSAILYIIDLFVFSFSELSASPYAILVLLIGIRYGILYGLFISGIILSLHIVNAWSSKEDIYSFIFFGNFSIFAIIYLLTAYISGIYATRYRERYEDKEAEREELQVQLEQAVTTLYTVNETNDVLEKKVLASEMTMINVYKMLQALDQDHVEMFINEVAKTLETYYGAKSLGVYHVDQSLRALRVKVRKGEEKLLPQTIFIDSAPMFYERLIKDESITIRRITDEENAPLLAAPIKINNQIRQIIVIQELDLSRLSNEGLSMLHMLIEIISEQLTKTWHKSEQQEQQQYYQHTKVFKPSSFKERIEIEKARLIEFQVPYCYVHFKTKPLANSDLQILETSLRKYLREIDLVAYYPRSNNLIILLPGTSKDHVKVIEDRLQQVVMGVLN